ncbi:MAG: 4-oxalomesaconate tautomerase [Gammaproteobacteria bacterium]|jgi:4-oxalomesaconate tautomerase|nr:4-oxalomesaconate tautomerase [Gammaproteobacteria bacterium]
MQNTIPCMLFRGGTSKGTYYLDADLPADPVAREEALLRIMGSPDIRQIDGVGGAHPLTSKVAIVKKSEREGIDVDYLFVQVVVDEARTSTAQNCGNILAGVGPFAIENGLVDAQDDETVVSVFMENTESIARQRILTPGKKVQYDGEASIDGVPGTHAPIMIEFVGVAGSSCGSLFPTGNAADEIDGLPVTMVDNGMPVVMIAAQSLGLQGDEAIEALENNQALKDKIEAIRLKTGPMMNLGDVKEKTVPKMTIVSPPKNGGLINTRSFIPHRVHDAVGVLAAASVAVAATTEGAVGFEFALIPEGDRKLCYVEHPTGALAVEIERSDDPKELAPKSTAIMRTARLLMSGNAYYIPAE